MLKILIDLIALIRLKLLRYIVNFHIFNKEPKR